MTKNRLYDESVATSATNGQNLFLHTPNHPAASVLRPERGYLAAKYDPNVENPPKSLRSQFGSFNLAVFTMSKKFVTPICNNYLLRSRPLASQKKPFLLGSLFLEKQL